MKHYITVTILAIFFLISAYVFTLTHQDFSVSCVKLTALKSEVHFLRLKQAEFKRTIEITNKAEKFVNHARSLGFERDRWAYYPVDIDEAFTFGEAGYLLEQTENTASYYFKPEMLHIKIIDEPDKKTPNVRQSQHSADSESTKTNDVLLKLKGTFIAKR